MTRNTPRIRTAAALITVAGTLVSAGPALAQSTGASGYGTTNNSGNTPTVVPPVQATMPSSSGVKGTPAGPVKGTMPSSSGVKGTPPAGGGVQGNTASNVVPAPVTPTAPASVGPSSGVAPSTANVANTTPTASSAPATSGTLPFTGLDVGLVAAIGIALLLAGTAIRRVARTASN